MNWIQNNENSLRSLFHAMLGSIVSAVFSRRRSILESVSCVFVGMVASYALTPYAAEYWQLTERGSNSAGFMIGLLAYNFLGWLWRAAKSPIKTVKEIKEIREA